MAKKNVVAFPPKSRQSLQRGVNTMARLLRPTLGPTSRTVLVDRIIRGDKAPEVLADAGVIARRFLGLGDPFVSTGAMLTRFLAVDMREGAGDGAATAVVLADAIVREAARVIAAGANAMALSRALDQAVPIVLEEMHKLATPVEEPAQMARLAQACCPEHRIAELLGEMYDIVGRDGIVMIEESSSRDLDREYAEGIQWNEGYASIYMITDSNKGDVTLVDPVIFVTNHRLAKVADVAPLMEKLVQAGRKSLFIMAKEISGDALATMVMNKERGILTTLAVKAPRYGKIMEGIMKDTAVLTGARYVREETGDRLADVVVEDLGRARRVWANRGFFNIWGGHGRPAEIRRRIAEVKSELKSINRRSEEYEWDRTAERLGKLMGGVAILKVGAPTEAEREELKALAEQTVQTIRVAVEEGVVPGAGATYLNCVPTLQRAAAEAQPGEQRWALQVLARALEEPARVILENAGYNADEMIGEVRRQPEGWGFDVTRGEFVDLVAAGIVDAHKVARLAVAEAVSTARLALTTDVLIHRPENTAMGPA